MSGNYTKDTKDSCSHAANKDYASLLLYRTLSTLLLFYLCSLTPSPHTSPHTITTHFWTLTPSPHTSHLTPSPHTSAASHHHHTPHTPHTITTHLTPTDLSFPALSHSIIVFLFQASHTSRYALGYVLAEGSKKIDQQFLGKLKGKHYKRHDIPRIQTMLGSLCENTKRQFSSKFYKKAYDNNKPSTVNRKSCIEMGVVGRGVWGKGGVGGGGVQRQYK